MRADAICFDKDGTLFDFAATWEAWAASFLLRAADDDHGRAAEIGQQIGFNLASNRFDKDSIVIAGTVQEVAAALVPFLPDMSIHTVVNLLNEEAETAPQAEAVPLAPFLDSLRRMGMLLGVATNDAEAPARAHLDAAGVIDRFEFIAGFDSGYGGKPAAGQLLAFAKSVRVPPKRVVMVGDSTHDLQAGRAAGMQTVGVLTGLAEKTDLAPFADIVFPDIGHLPDWLTA
ncbi:MAG: HAD family hydrolase [Paracoccaceae bacterium]